MLALGHVSYWYIPINFICTMTHTQTVIGIFLQMSLKKISPILKVVINNALTYLEWLQIFEISVS